MLTVGALSAEGSGFSCGMCFYLRRDCMFSLDGESEPAMCVDVNIPHDAD